jgi:hypothetical protein
MGTMNALKTTLFLLCMSIASIAYEVPILDTDYSRQICSGMWGSQSTYINSENPPLFSKALNLFIYYSYIRRYITGSVSHGCVRMERRQLPRESNLYDG